MEALFFVFSYIRHGDILEGYTYAVFVFNLTQYKVTFKTGNLGSPKGSWVRCWRTISFNPPVGDK